MWAFFGTQMTVHEKQISWISVKKYLEPITNFRMIEKDKVWHWYREVHTALLMYLESCDYEKELKGNTIKVVIGADKGKKKVRALIKVLIRAQDTSILQNYVLKVGHIDSESNSYSTIKNTIGKQNLISLI